jgi:SPX domain protein involved in polyphosphate accumulation
VSKGPEHSSGNLVVGTRVQSLQQDDHTAAKREIHNPSKTKHTHNQELIPVTEYTPATGFRYERKFLVDELDDHEVRAIVKLHPSVFTQAYPPRFVNNIYLDSQDMGNYLDNVSGVGDRRKVRIRWYGELFGRIDHPILEFKIKRGLVGTKEQHFLTPFTLQRGFSKDTLDQLLENSDLPELSRARLADLNGVLVNRYYRWYFATLDGRYRVTVDTNLSYHRVSTLKSSFTHRQVDHNNIVVELKYQSQDEGSANRVSSHFPFRVTRNSKYVSGIERVFFQ